MGENLVSTLAPSFYLQVTSFFFILAGNQDIYNISDNSNFIQIQPRTAELAALERLKKFPYTYNWENLVSTLAPSFLIRSSSFLQVMRTTIKAWMSSNLGKILSLTSELVALECLKKCHIILLAL